MTAELRKLLTLPSVWFALGFGLLSPPLVQWINSRAVLPRDADTGFMELLLGLVGPIVLGVVSIGSEYRGQIATSLVCVPSRVRLLALKAGALVLVTAAHGVLTATLNLAVAGVLADTAVSRIAGVGVYWVLTALLAYGITILTRSGTLPLVVLILNGTTVSISLLLSRVTPLAVYLPDVAGPALFLRTSAPDLPARIGPVTGGLVMAAWVVALLGVAGAVFRRRDA